MNNSGTPTGENGRKEIKVTKSNDADKLLDKYFEDLKEEGYDKINLNALIYEVPEVAIKSKGGDDDNERENFAEAINVLESGRQEFVLEEIAKGAGFNVKLADKKKVKAKADSIRKAKAEAKKSATGGMEKPTDDDIIK